MKKLVLSALLAGLFLIPTTNVSAQNEQKETSHWSLGVRGGGTYFRVSPNAGDILENMSWGLGGVLEYTINPLWGLGLSVDFLNFNRGDDMLGRTIDAVIQLCKFIELIISKSHRLEKRRYLCQFRWWCSFL